MRYSSGEERGRGERRNDGGDEERVERGGVDDGGGVRGGGPADRPRDAHTMKAGFESIGSGTKIGPKIF